MPGKELPEFGQCFVPGVTGGIGGQRELRFSLQQLRHPFRAGLPNRWYSVSLNNVEGRNHILPFRKFAEPGELTTTGPRVKTGQRKYRCSWDEGCGFRNGRRAAFFEATAVALAARSARTLAKSASTAR